MANARATYPGGASQSWTSIVTDLAYFATVTALGIHHVIDGQAVVALLGFYGAGRVATGMRKNEARSAYYEGAANASGQMRAVNAPIVESTRGAPRDDRNDDDDDPPKRASGTGTLIAPLAPPVRPGRDHRREPSDPPPPRIPRPTRFDLIADPA